MSGRSSKRNRAVSAIQNSPEVALNKKESNITVSSFKGKLPPPALLIGYEEILPGLAERIVRMAEKDQDLYIKDQEQYYEIMKTDIALTNATTKRAQILGFVLGLIGICGSGVLLFFDKSIGGLATLILSLGSLIWTSMYGKMKTDDTPKEE